MSGSSSPRHLVSPSNPNHVAPSPVLEDQVSADAGETWWATSNPAEAAPVFGAPPVPPPMSKANVKQDGSVKIILPHLNKGLAETEANAVRRYSLGDPLGLPESDLMAVYSEMLATDSGVKTEAIEAYKVMKESPVPISEQESKEIIKGKVSRRAPLNPLSSPRLGKYRQQKPGQKKPAPKVADPALKNNPLRGRLVMTLTSSAILFFVFMQALCFNKVYTSMEQKPRPLDTGVGKFHAPFSTNFLMGPDSMVLWYLGGLNVDRIRNNGEAFRIFWGMWMHAGWGHVAINVVLQLQFFWMFEPDWGFWKCFLMFVISGVTGNLVSGAANPCSTTVGSSGGMFGLMGAMIPYCIEFWATIPRPGLILCFSFIVGLASLAMGFTPHTDNWAHIGGFIGGICFGLGAIKTLGACRTCPGQETVKKISRRMTKKNVAEDTVAVVVGPDGTRRKKIVKTNKVTRPVEKGLKWQCGKREWIVRILMFSILIALWLLAASLIFIRYEYQPLGQVTYSGVVKCCCCYDPGVSKGKYWRCLPCAYETRPGRTWGDTCKMNFSKSSSFNLKPEFQKKGLFEALGWGSMGADSVFSQSFTAPEKQTLPRLPPPDNSKDKTKFSVALSSGKVNSFVETKSGTPGTKPAVTDLLPFADILPTYYDNEKAREEIERVAKEDLRVGPRRDYQKYFVEKLTPEELEYLEHQEQRYRQRTALFKDIMKTASMYPRDR